MHLSLEWFEKVVGYFDCIVVGMFLDEKWDGANHFHTTFKIISIVIVERIIHELEELMCQSVMMYVV